MDAGDKDSETTFAMIPFIATTFTGDAETVSMMVNINRLPAVDVSLATPGFFPVARPDANVTTVVSLLTMVMMDATDARGETGPPGYENAVWTKMSVVWYCCVHGPVVKKATDEVQRAVRCGRTQWQHREP